MEENSILTKVKQSVRVSHTSLDDSIQQNIDSALSELIRVGVSETVATNSSSDPLIITACELYHKWIIDYMAKGEQHKKAFDALRDSLSLNDSYRGDSDV